MWIQREGWHPAPPPCGSRAEPSAGAGLNPPQPWQPPGRGTGCSQGQASCSYHAHSSLAADIPGPSAPPDAAARGSVRQGCKLLPSTASDGQHPPCGLGRAWAKPHSPTQRLRPDWAQPPKVPVPSMHSPIAQSQPCSRVLLCSAVRRLQLQPLPIPQALRARQLGLHPHQGAPGSCAGFGSHVLWVAPICLELHPYPGPERGQPLPGWYEPASGWVCEGSMEQALCGLEGGRTVHPSQQVP